MIKRYFTTINIVFFLWGILLLFISNKYGEYTRYYLYLSIIAIVPFIIIKIIKQRKEDQTNGTTTFKASIYRMLFMAGVLIVFFFISMQNQL